MYQLSEIERRHESLQEKPEHYSAHPNNVTRSHARLRVVRVPGGFAYLEEGSTTRRD